MQIARLLSVASPSLAVAAVTLAGLHAGGYLAYVVSLALIAMTIGAALVLVVGLARMITLASGAMMGIGAYGVTLLMMHTPVGMIGGMIGAVVLGALAGTLLGVLTTRFRGHHLAMVTLVFQFVVIIGMRQWTGLTGGAHGIWVPTGTILGYTLDSDEHQLLLVGIVGMISVTAIAVLVRGPFGKALHAISATEVGAEAYGIDIRAFRIMAFTVSSAVIALAGAVHAFQVRVLEPEAYGVLHSVSMLAYPIVGGLTSVWGGLIGGGLLRSLPEMLRGVAEYQELVYAALVIAMIILVPDGLAGLAGPALCAWRGKTQRRRAEAASFAPASATAPARAPAADGPLALEVSGVSKSFGALAAVGDMSLRIRPGTIHGVIGPNGAGKTTLFNMISGFTRPDVGTIAVFGQDLAGLSARDLIRFGVTRTFQNVAIYRQLTCLDNVLMGLGENGVGTALRRSAEEAAGTAAARARAERALEALRAVGIGHLAAETAGNLSLGNQRCLEIARALVSNPKLLMLDEPVSGLELEEQDQVRELLRRINAERGTTMLVIEHNVRFVVGLSHTMSVMHMGRLLAEGEPQRVVEEPEVRRVYFGETGQAA